MNAPHPTFPAVRTPAANFIGNAWREPAQRGELPMIDPSDGAPFDCALVPYIARYLPYVRTF